MAHGSEGDTTSARAVALRALLNEWDFIGVVRNGILDEYDCLIPGIGERLDAGAGADELHAFLAHELIHHFGLGGAWDERRERFVDGVLRLR
jgi:hypothetical protein